MGALTGSPDAGIAGTGAAGTGVGAAGVAGTGAGAVGTGGGGGLPGTGLTLAITGAAGFLGRATVAAALARGHRVRALVRRAGSAPPDWGSEARVTVVVADLCTAAAGLEAALTGADAVIHAAGSFDPAAQDRDTLMATRTLVGAMRSASARDATGKAPAHLVLVSSMAVYAAPGVAGSTLTEASPLERDPGRRDAYCRAKLQQEAIAVAAAPSWGGALTILRPGAIFGPGRLWNAHVGLRLGPVLLRLGGAGQIPLCQVGHCAAALVLAAEHRPIGVEVLNLVDDDLPDRHRFVAALRHGRPGRSGWPRLVVPLSWRLFAAVAAVAERVPGLAARLPGLLRRPVLRARMMPQRYANAAARTRLGWRPDRGFAAAAQAACAVTDHG